MKIFQGSLLSLLTGPLLSPTAGVELASLTEMVLFYVRSHDGRCTAVCQ